MFYLILGSFSVIWGFAGAAEAWPYQQGRGGPNITSEHRSDLQGNLYVGPTESFKSTPSKYYECHGTNICETGVHFCSERRRACEKCADYQTTCGTNFQNPNCTQYCMNVLIQEILAKGKCNETVTTKSSLTTTEKALDYRQKTNSSAPANNLETCSSLMWIYVGFSIVLTASVSCNIYQYCCGKGPKQTERIEQEETGVLWKARLTDIPVDTQSSLDFNSKQYTSACPKEDVSGRHSVMPSVLSISKEKLDLDETSIKSHNKHLPIRVNINIHNEQTGLSTTPTKNSIQPKDPRKEVPFGVEETDADFNHGKLVSDEDQNGRLALPEISADINFKKASPNG